MFIFGQAWPCGPDLGFALRWGKAHQANRLKALGSYAALVRFVPSALAVLLARARKRGVNRRKAVERVLT
jgi:hypothetical protein